MNRRGAALAAAATLGVTGCPWSSDTRDRTIERLEAERVRLEREGPRQRPARPPTAEERLAAVAAAGAASEGLAIPRGASADLGDVALSLREVQMAQTVGQRIRVSTLDRFVRVSLDAEARAPTSLDLSGALLMRGDRVFPIARDAHRAGGGTPLAPQLGPGARVRLVLYFEAPLDALGPGLKLVLSAPDSRVELTLQ